MREKKKAESTMLTGGMRFTSVQDLLDFLPPDERAWTERLRELLIQEALEMVERVSFNLPFNRVHRASASSGRPAYSGASARPIGVRIGFSYGILRPVLRASSSVATACRFSGATSWH